MSFDYFSKSRMQYILTKLKVILDAKAVPGDIKNGTLTIQKNGTNVQTFSANQSNNSTANIIVPTKTSDLTNDSGFTTNTGTVTSVSAGVGLAGGPVTGSGSLKAKLKSETKLANDSTAATEKVGRIYPVVQDKSGYLATVVPWEDTSEFTDKIEDNEAYALRQGKGNLVDMDIVGGSLAWNQLVQNGNFANTNDWAPYLCNFTVSNNVATITSTDANTSGNIYPPNNSVSKAIAGHKYLYSADIKSGSGTLARIKVTAGDTYKNETTTSTSFVNFSGILNCASISSNQKAQFEIYATKDGGVANARNCMFFDLTQLFGSTIADYIYSLEQATEGAGVEWFRQYFPNNYYAYDPGSIQSVNVASRKVVGKNLYNKDAKNTHNGFAQNKYLINTGSIQNGSDDDISEYIKVFPNTSYVLSGVYGNLASYCLYDGNKTFISGMNYNGQTTLTFNSQSAEYVRFTVHHGCENAIQFEFGSVATDYESYKEFVYSFDSTKPLRGIPKLLNNKLSYDGDIYKADGQITRKYGIVNLSDLTWYYSSNYALFYAELVDCKYSGRDGLVGYDCVCSKYISAGDKTWNNFADKDINTGSDTRGSRKPCVNIKDTSYSDAATFKTAMSGVYLVYELATPTTESANAYQNPQRAFTDGIEEFIDAGVSAGTRDLSIPVGTDAFYYPNKSLPFIEDYVDEVSEELLASLGTASTKNSTSVVTQSSDLVESGAVKDIVGWGNKNLLPNNASSITTNGITFTVNDDGSVTANGTATGSNAQLIIYLPSNLSGNYLFSSGLQPAGSDTTYDASIWDYTSNARTKKWDGTTNGNLSFDSSFNETKIVAGHSTALIWRVRSGKTVNNVVLNPMICRATETDTTYEPYHASVEDTIKQEIKDTVGWLVNNLFTAEGATSGYQLWSNGSTYEISNWSYSDYIPIDSNRQSVLVLPLTGNNPAIVFYNANKEYISGIAYTNRRTVLFTTPDNTAFCRVSYLTNSGVSELRYLTVEELLDTKADKSATVSTVAWDSTNKKITKTINGSTSDVVTAATILANLTSSQVTTALGYTPPQDKNGMMAYCDTAAATQDKVATCSNFSRNYPGYVIVVIKNSNSYNGKITLNINNTGKKNIYINGDISSSSNKTLPAGTYLVFMDSSNYYFRTDGRITSSGVVDSYDDEYEAAMSFNIWNDSTSQDIYFPGGTGRVVALAFPCSWNEDYSIPTDKIGIIIVQNSNDNMSFGCTNSAYTLSHRSSHTIEVSASFDFTLTIIHTSTLNND